MTENIHGDAPEMPAEYFESLLGENVVNAGDRFAQRGRPQTPPPVSLKILSPTDWKDKPVPPRKWTVPELVPQRTVTTVSGDGAAGKSTLVLQLCVAGAAGKQWLGIPFRPVDSLYLSAEDDTDELHRRVAAIANHYDVDLADLGNMRLIDLVGQDAVLGTFDKALNQIKATALFDAIDKLLTETPADVVVIDSLADAFAGIENDRQHARQFVGLMKRLCQMHNVTVIIIAHPSLTGISSGTGSSGSTAWNNSVRSRLYFETDKGADGRGGDPDLRTLTTMKANYGPMGGKIQVRYERGAFVALEAGGGLDKATREAKADRVFLELLRKSTDQNINVSANPGSTYAPTAFACRPDAEGLSKTEFRAAMVRTMNAGQVIVENFGPPSKLRTRLVIEDRGAE